MDKKVGVKFYWVQRRRPGDASFHQALHAIHETPIENRHREISDRDVRLERLTGRFRSSLVFGEFVRIQTVNKPAMASFTAPQQPLRLPPGQHLSHSVVFAYDPACSIIAVQSGRVGITTSVISGYVREMFGDIIYSLIPVFQRDALERLAQISARKVRVKLAAPINLEAVSPEQGEWRNAVRDLQRLSGGPWVDMVVSVGRADAEIRPSFLRGIVGWLAGEATEDRGLIRSLRVEGDAEDDEESLHFIDLLSEQMKADSTLDLPEDDPDQSYEIRTAFLQSVFEQHRGYLETYGQ